MVLASLTIFIALVCAGLATDIGVILSVRSQLQSATDAAVLAGARGYITDEEKALEYASALFNSNKVQNHRVWLSQEELTFPSQNRITCEVTRPASLYFLRVVGLNSVNITVRASAMFGTLRNSDGFKPWAVPDVGWEFGDQVIIKTGAVDNSPLGSAQCWHYPICFPPINRGNPVTGSSAYLDNIISGSSSTVEVGDQLLIEPGNMVGPTQQGVSDIISQDPCAYWTTDGIEGSNFQGNSSPRICKLLLIDSNTLPEVGRTEVTVTRFGVFFIESMQGQNLIGRYMRIATTGEMTHDGNGDSDLFGVKLIE